MISHGIDDWLRLAAEVGGVALEVTPAQPGIADAASCECGLPEVYCDDYCSIDDCDWLVY